MLIGNRVKTPLGEGTIEDINYLANASKLTAMIQVNGIWWDSQVIMPTELERKYHEDWCNISNRVSPCDPTCAATENDRVNCPYLFHPHSYASRLGLILGKEEEQLYPCSKRGKLRTDGGTTFTVCGECWEKSHSTEQEEKE